MCHLSALVYSHPEILSDSKKINHTEKMDEAVETKVVKVESFNGNSTSADSSDSSFDLDGGSKESLLNASVNLEECDSPIALDESLQRNGQRPRLPAF